ncbi:MAG: hypothetical protein RIC56_15215 [Pseudomonadales bacterium]
MVILGLLLGGWFTATIPAAYGAAPACDSAPYRAFDFWVGSWEVTVPDGRPAGSNVIERAQGGCLLLERWRGNDGTTGTSMNVYDPAAGQWRQLWVSPGTLIDIAGGLRDGNMVLEGTITYFEGPRTLPFRGTWTPLEDGRVRQFFEQADADGAWTPWFDGIYARTGG